MAALTADRSTRLRAQGTHRHRSRGVAANAKCYKGGIACINATGYLVPASDIAGLICVGIFEQSVDNTGGADGALSACYVTGCEAELVNAGGAVVQATLKAVVADDQSVTTAAVGVHDVAVGPVVDFSATLVWVFIDELANQTASV